MTARLQKLRQQITIGVVGGSDLIKQKEQLGENGMYECVPCAVAIVAALY